MPPGAGRKSVYMLELEGIKPSSQILDELAEEGKPVILNFSRGKDSVALWAELHKRGMQVIPVHYSMVPDLQFVKSDLQRYEQHYQTHIYDLPADTFYDMLQHNLNQPPERAALCESFRLSAPDKDEYDAVFRANYAEPNTWMLDGVRATDSSMRRMAIMKHGPVKPKTRRISGIWDFHVADVREAVKQGGIELGIDYQWWNHSFEGLWYQYLEPIRRNAPEDYERILFWFPMLETEILRGGGGHLG